MNAQEISDSLGGKFFAEKNYYYANCPAHTDNKQSLVIFDFEDGTTELVCPNGCSKEAIEEGIERRSNRFKFLSLHDVRQNLKGAQFLIKPFLGVR